MSENNNLNNGMNPNPTMPMDPNGGMNPNPTMPVDPNVEMDENPVMSSPVEIKKTKKGNKKLPIIIGIVAAVVVFVVVAIVLLFGGKKTLTCRQEQNLDMGMNMNTIINFKFKGRNVENADWNAVVNLGNYASFKDTFIRKFEEEFASFAEKGLDVKITSDNTNIYIKFSVDRQKFEAANLSVSGKYKQIKTDMEIQGYVCE